MSDNYPTPPENAPEIGRRYRHYKGTVYLVVGLGRSGEDAEWMVAYTPANAPDIFPWYRSLKRWLEVLEDGTPRYHLLEPATV